MKLTDAICYYQAVAIDWQPFLPSWLAHAKTIGIAGFAREGQSTYRLLRHWFTDKKIVLVDKAAPSATIAVGEKTECHWNERDFSKLSECDVIFRSPGIHPRLLPTTPQVVSQLQLLLDLLRTYNRQLSAPPPSLLSWASYPFVTIGVTGTKGKSTTTTFLHHLLMTAGFKTLKAGNMGAPMLDILDLLNIADEPTFICLELSSHQLQDVSTSPNLAILQEIVPEHQDYFSSVEEYVSSKLHIVRYQEQGDLCLYHTSLADLLKEQKLVASPDGPNVIPFSLGDLSRHDSEHWQVTYDGSRLAWGQSEFAAMLVNQTQLLGAHTLVNVVPGIVVGKALDVADETISEALRTFVPVPHRLELVGEKNGARWINDSAATTPEASLAALSTFADEKVCLVAGGGDKGIDFTPWLTAVAAARNVVQILLFPPMGPSLQQQLATLGRASTVVNSMTEVGKRIDWSCKPSVILLSPGLTSFGVFKDYAERGEQFKMLLHQ